MGQNRNWITIERDEENIFVKGRPTGDIEKLNVESGDLGRVFSWCRRRLFIVISLEIAFSSSFRRLRHQYQYY
jgi:hypothetical protein